MLFERLIFMDLKERTPKNILIRYIITTLILWGLGFGVFAGLRWWEVAGDNSMARSLIAPVTTMLIFSSILIPDGSARVALGNQRIIPSDTHLKGLTGMIIIANLVLYSIPFIVFFFLIDEISFYLFGSIALVVVNITVFLSTFWKFKPHKTKLSAEIKLAENEVIKKDENENIVGIVTEKLPEFKIYPSKREIKRGYDFVLASIFRFLVFGLILGALLDQYILFLIILFLAPTLGFGWYYYRLNYYKFKRIPTPFKVEHGHQLTRMIFRTNLIFLLVLAGLSTLLILSHVLDGDMRADGFFWLMLGLMWLFFILSFLPLFILSHLHFKKLEREALDLGRIFAKHDLHSKRLQIKGKKTDESLRKFFIDIGLGNVDYLVGGMMNKMNIDDTLYNRHMPTIIAFNTTDVYVFSYNVGSSKLSFNMTFPISAMIILRTLAHKNERRVQFAIGQTIPALFVAHVEKKGLLRQNEMFQRFITL